MTSDLTSMTLPELRALAKEYGLPTSGTKTTLVDRITKARQEQDDDLPEPEPLPTPDNEDEEDVFASDDPNLAAASSGGESGEAVLRDGLLRILDYPVDAPVPGDERLLELVAARIHNPTPTPEQVAQIRRTALEEAARSVVATLGRGGTVTKRILALADQPKAEG